MYKNSILVLHVTCTLIETESPTLRYFLFIKAKKQKRQSCFKWNDW